MEGLSPQQQAVYDFIWKYGDEHDYNPSIADVAAGLQIAQSTAATYVEALIAKGYATCEYGVPRSLRVVRSIGNE